MALWWWRFTRNYSGRALPPPTGLVTAPPYDWTPVQVGLLLNWGELTVRDLVATLVDLVGRGALVLTVEPRGKPDHQGTRSYEYILERGPDYASDLTPSERFLIDEVLFCQPGLERIAPLHEVMREGAHHFIPTCQRVEQWRNLAAREQLPITLECRYARKARGTAMAVGAVLLCLALPTAVVLYQLTGLSATALFLTVPMLVAGTGFLVGAQRVHKATDASAVARALWGAYRDHLASEAGMAHWPMQDFVARGRPGAYAVSLGLARSLVQDLRFLCPDVQTVGVY